MKRSNVKNKIKIKKKIKKTHSTTLLKDFEYRKK